MTNAPESRKTHITRIFGTNKNRERLEDVYVDIERMDIVKSAHQVPPDLQWQGVQRQFRWCDDPNADDYNPDGTASRILETLKVCDVESEDDVSNPEEWIPIEVNKGIKSRSETGTEVNGGGAMDRFLASVTADELQTARKFVVRRTVHKETNYDDIIDAAAEADPSLLMYVIPADQYQKDDSTRDKDQYIEQEIITYLKSSGSTYIVNGQDSQTQLLNQYLIDESEDATGEVIGPNGFNPAWRLDPYQTIVNVSFGGLAVEFFDEDSAEITTKIPDSKKITVALWFRAEAASLAAATAEIEAWKNDNNNTPIPRPPLCGVVPLVTIGPSGKVEGIDQNEVVIGTFPGGCAMLCDQGAWKPRTTSAGLPACNDPSDDMGSDPSLNGSFRPCDPSYIGIDCSGDYPMFSVNIITPYKNKAKFFASRPIATATTYTGDFNNYGDPHYTIPGGQGQCSGVAIIPPGFPGQGLACAAQWTHNNLTVEHEKSGAPTSTGSRNEVFRLLPQQNIGESIGGDATDEHFQGIRIVPGQWHHAIVSIDLTNGCITTGQVFDVNDPDVPDPRPTVGGRATVTPRMFVAVDDVNYQGEKLSAYFPKGYADRNGVCSVNGYNVACEIQFEGTQALDIIDGVQTPCQGNLDEVTQVLQGIPKYIFKPSAIELSGGPLGAPAANEWSDATKHVELAAVYVLTDLAVDTSKKDNRRAFITDEGKPAPISMIKKTFGKEPEVILSPGRNLKKGRNVGALADDPVTDGLVIGKPKRYKPEPSLFGDQG